MRLATPYVLAAVATGLTTLEARAGSTLELPSAEALIAACEAAPADCVGRRDALAEAYLVRAQHAAEDRGEVDCVAVANATALDAARVDAWPGALPSHHGTPAEPWVQALASGAVPPARVPPAVLVTARGLIPFVPTTLRPLAPVAEVAVRVGVAPRVGIEAAAWVDGSGGRVSTWLAWDGGEASVRGRWVRGGVSVGAGLWDTLRGEGEHAFVAGPSLLWRSPSNELHSAAFETYSVRGPASGVGVGVQLRDHARVAMTRRWFFAIDAIVALGATWDVRVPPDVDSRYTTDAWPQAHTVDGDVGDPLRVDLALGFEVRPSPTARVGLAVRAVMEQRLVPASPAVRVGPELAVAWSTRTVATAVPGR
ncbi:MAG: hypothetical protein H6733_11325 [Alphaproteobacteria bacterium]|nr:hypothetical protein [Alphaproteobacteria bacterium]